MVKIVRVDNLARETYAENLVADNIANEDEAAIMCEALCNWTGRGHEDWYRVAPDDYKLWRGMEELV